MSKYILTTLFFLIAAVPFLPLYEKEGDQDLSENTSGEVLSIISPHNREVKMAYTRGFGEWMRKQHQREVSIRWLDVGGTSKVLKDLESRFETNPDAPGVDLLFGGGVDPYIRAKMRGWLTPVEMPDAILGGIPERCAGMPVYDPEKYWFGVALSGFGVIYNRILQERLKLQPPSGWDTLASPPYRTWVGSGDPRSSGSVHMCYEIILQAYGFERGWGLITRLCANVRHFGESGGTAPREVSSGDVVAGMVIDQYAQRAIASIEEAYELVNGAKQKEKSLGFVLPEGATIIGPDAIGVLKGAPQPQLATLFVQYALSEAGQRLLFQPAGTNGQRHGLHRMPVRVALYQDRDAPSVNPFQFQAGMQYNDGIGEKRWNVLNDMIGKWNIDAHADLTAAWKAIIDAGLPEDLVIRLCQPPVTEKELLDLAQNWQEPRTRQEILNAWALGARKRYRTLLNEAQERSFPRDHP